MPSTLRALHLAVTTIGAVTRLTKLVTSDTITEPLRYRIPDRAQRDATANGTALPAPSGEPAWAYRRQWAYALAMCPWCLSVWISPPVVLLAYRYGHTRAYQTAADSLTVALLAGWAVSNLDNTGHHQHDHGEDHD